jgi:hypothetical protein
VRRRGALDQRRPEAIARKPVRQGWACDTGAGDENGLISHGHTRRDTRRSASRIQATNSQAAAAKKTASTGIHISGGINDCLAPGPLWTRPAPRN